LFVEALDGVIADAPQYVCEPGSKVTVLPWAVGVNAAATIANLGILLRYG
jgi:hypothetical protein